MARGRRRSSGRAARQRADGARPDDGAGRRPRHVFSLEVLYTPYRLPGGWPGSSEPRRWLELFATLVRAGVPRQLGDVAGDDARRVRARVPPPAGHATSFAGGPLAAFRNAGPRADPLRDRRSTGCTSPVRPRFPAPASGAPAGATARRRAARLTRDKRTLSDLGPAHGVTRCPLRGGNWQPIPVSDPAVVPTRQILRYLSPRPLERGPHRDSSSASAVSMARPRRRRHRHDRLPRLDPAPRVRATPSWPAASASRPSRSSCGRSAASPASTGRRRTAGRGLDRRRRPAEPASPIAVGSLRPAFALERRMPSRGRRRARLARFHQRSPWRSSTCCRAPRSTAAASSRRSAGASTAIAYRAAREAATPAASLGWAMAGVGLWLMLHGHARSASS